MNIIIEIEDTKLARLLGLAKERGITYWCSSVKCLKGATIYDHTTIKHLDQPLYYPLHDGKWVLVDSVQNKSLLLNHGALLAGMHTLIERNLPALTVLIEGGPYAELGDMLIQYAVFGELRYARGSRPGEGAVYVCAKCQTPQPCSCCLVGLA